MIHAFFGKTELKWMQKVRSGTYYLAQFWMHTGCNQNASGLDPACLLGVYMSSLVPCMFAYYWYWCCLLHWWFAFPLTKRTHQHSSAVTQWLQVYSSFCVEGTKIKYNCLILVIALSNLFNLVHVMTSSYVLMQHIYSLSAKAQSVLKSQKNKAHQNWFLIGNMICNHVKCCTLLILTSY